MKDALEKALEYANAGNFSEAYDLAVANKKSGTMIGWAADQVLNLNPAKDYESEDIIFALFLLEVTDKSRLPMQVLEDLKAKLARLSDIDINSPNKVAYNAAIAAASFIYWHYPRLPEVIGGAIQNGGGLPWNIPNRARLAARFIEQNADRAAA